MMLSASKAYRNSPSSRLARFNGHTTETDVRYVRYACGDPAVSHNAVSNAKRYNDIQLEDQRNRVGGLA